MPPDWRDPGNPRNPRMNSVPTIPLRTSIEKSALAPPGGSIFKDFPERGHKGPQGGPKGAKESKRAAQGIPNEAEGSTKEGQQELNGVPEGPKGIPWHPKASSKEAYIHKNSGIILITLDLLVFWEDCRNI